MIVFKTLENDDPVLLQSPLVRAIMKTSSYMVANGGIDLAPSKAFKRVFVHWAAAEFDWPGWTEEDLFAINKVLNEIDFPPLVDVHDLMIAVKLGRHYKKKFILTKFGKEFINRPGRIMAEIIPFYLFALDHAHYSPIEESLPGGWDVFLNVLNVEAENGATGADLRRVFFGDPDPDTGYDRISGSFYIQVLRPLCSTGLLREENEGNYSSDTSVYYKTPLWYKALELETDGQVRNAKRPSLLH